MKTRRDLRRLRMRHLSSRVAPAASAHESTAQAKTNLGEISDLVFGVQPVRELAAAAPSRIRKLYVKRGAETRFQAEIHAVSENGGEVLVVASDDLARMAGSETRHQ